MKVVQDLTKIKKNLKTSNKFCKSKSWKRKKKKGRREGHKPFKKHWTMAESRKLEKNQK
jgi:hypothetical protein